MSHFQFVEMLVRNLKEALKTSEFENARLMVLTIIIYIFVIILIYYYYWFLIFLNQTIFFHYN